MIPYHTYLRRVVGEAPAPRSERLPLERALGRVLLEDVRARVDDPAEARSAMDGYAVKAADLAAATPGSPVFLIQRGVTPAGPTRQTTLRSGDAYRIMTGAPLPRGADTIVPIEEVTVDRRTVCFARRPLPGTHVRRAGDNFHRGDVLIREGTPLRPQEIGLAITAGHTTVRVSRRLRVGVLSTGDELVPPGSRLGRGAVYDSNRPAIVAMVEATGAETVDLGRCADRTEALSRIISRHRGRLDLLISIGGVSAGDFDVVKFYLSRFPGVEMVKVGMRPAKPQAFGRLGRLLWYGLPGNPVSAMVAFDRFVRPLIMRGMGHRLILRPVRRGICTKRIAKTHRLREFVRAEASSAGGTWRVRPVGPPGSSNLRSMVNANAFIVLPERSGGIERGEQVEFELFSDPPGRALP